MKKIGFLVLTAILLSSVVWADPSDPDRPTVSGTIPSWPSIAPLRKIFSDMLYTMPTMSAESRYSAGVFSSMVDDYIDVNNYDPNTGTFLFLGGYPSKSGNITNTEYLTGDATSDPAKYAISFGMGKTLKSIYLGLYYSGSLVNSIGYHSEAIKNDYAGAVWRNNTAVLIGTDGYGAFRFDMLLDTDSEKLKVGNDILVQGGSPAPSLSLTWGGLKLAGMDTRFSAGFIFPKEYIWGTSSGTYRKIIYSGGAGLGLQAGINYDFNENSSFLAELFFGSFFGSNYKGDTDALPAGLRAELASTGSNVNLNYGGQYGIGLKAAYKQTLDFGNVSAGFKPLLGIMFISDSSNIVTGDVSNKAHSNYIFDVFTSVDLGIKFQLNNKFAFYSGATLQIIDWMYFFQSGGSGEKSRGYSINGIKWSNDQFGYNTYTSKNTLGFGMTLTPMENLVIGTGLNTFLDKFFVINLKDMTAGTGSFFGSSSENNIGDWATRLVRNLSFDLTVSFKF